MALITVDRRKTGTHPFSKLDTRLCQHAYAEVHDLVSRTSLLRDLVENAEDWIELLQNLPKLREE